jgi:general nucleoside transport system ATP-binding protein
MSEAIKYAVEMRGITKRFGDVMANDQIEIAIPARTIHAIVGENGAGKSTAMNILYGFYTADEGEILIDGGARAINNPKEAIALGLGMVHQHFMLVEPLTVTENIILGAEPVAGLAIDYRRARARVREISEQYGLRVNPDARIKDLSVGQQQRVEILKTLYRGARILILDEPTAVLTPQEVGEMFTILRGLREQGKTIIIITHKLHEVLELSDNITVMRDGKTVGNLPTGEATAEGLARMMVGRDVLLRVEKDAARPRDPVLTVRGLSLQNAEGAHALKEVSFEVRGGEILGIAGVEGNGQTELIEAIAGLRPASSGQILLADGAAGLRDVTKLSVRERADAGLSHIPEDRHVRGLILDYSVADNLILGLQHHFSRGVRLDWERVAENARQQVAAFDIRPPDPMLPARALSGGNQQKVVIAREMGRDFRVLLAAQPTRGVDVGAIEFIHSRLREARSAGKAILLVSADLAEVLALSDRIGVMYGGRLVAVLPRAEANLEILGRHMTGAAEAA